VIARGFRVDNAAQAEIARRDSLKAKRDKLFAQYLRFPSNTKLAVEIKLIDDDIARSVEKSDGRKSLRV
jgi:hypothetical protein